MNELTLAPHKTRFLVWTDHEAHAAVYRQVEATWFWSASGPRGHRSGAEATAERALHYAQSAFASLMGEHEFNRPAKVN